MLGEVSALPAFSESDAMSLEAQNWGQAYYEGQYDATGQWAEYQYEGEQGAEAYQGEYEYPEAYYQGEQTETEQTFEYPPAAQPEQEFQIPATETTETAKEEAVGQ